MGQITRRDLFRWGLFTTSGLLLYKNGFSPYAPSAYAPGPDRHAAQPAVRRQEILPGDAAPRRAEAQQADARGGHRRLHVRRPPERVSGQGHVVSHGFHGRSDQHAVPQSPHQPRPLRGQTAGTDLRPSALGRVPPQVRLRDVGRLGAQPTPYVTIRTSPGRHPTASGATARASSPRARCRLRSSRRATASPSLMRIYNNLPIDRGRRTTASGATRRSCTSTTPTTARKATGRPTCTISRARSTTTAGAPRSPGATRSIQRWPPTRGRRARRQRRPRQGARRLPRAAGHAVGPRPPLLLHRRECLQGQSRDGELCTAVRIAATRRSPTASI